MSEYIYPRTDKRMSAGQLSEEIEGSLGYSTRIRVNPVEVWIQFESELTTEEKATLDSLVVDHEIRPEPVVLPLCQHLAEITEIDPDKSRPVSAVVTFQGAAFPLECFVTQDLVDAYLGGELAIGDLVVICFLEGQEDRPLASQKVYKSWP